MGNGGFVNIILDNTDRIYRLSFNQFEWWKKVQGTKCQVTRIKENDSYKNVFGSIANSTLPDDEDAEKFPYIILISLNDMKKIFQKSIDQIQFYDNEDTLKLGDIISFSRLNQEYKWKVIDVQSFNETASVLHQYTISGLTETNALNDV